MDRRPPQYEDVPVNLVEGYYLTHVVRDEAGAAVKVAEHVELLSADEHRAMDLTVELVNLLASRIVGRCESREGDLRELVFHVHGIQRAVLKQAAARAYPDRYRLLGEVL